MFATYWIIGSSLNLEIMLTSKGTKLWTCWDQVWKSFRLVYGRKTVGWLILSRIWAVSWRGIVQKMNHWMRLNFVYVIQNMRNYSLNGEVSMLGSSMNQWSFWMCLNMLNFYLNYNSLIIELCCYENDASLQICGVYTGEKKD